MWERYPLICCLWRCESIGAPPADLAAMHLSAASRRDAAGRSAMARTSPSSVGAVRCRRAGIFICGSMFVFGARRPRSESGLQIGRPAGPARRGGQPVVGQATFGNRASSPSPSKAASLGRTLFNRQLPHCTVLHSDALFFLLLPSNSAMQILKEIKNRA